MQTDNQCAASLIRCLAEVLRRGKSEQEGDRRNSIFRYDFRELSSQLDEAGQFTQSTLYAAPLKSHEKPSRGARHFTLAALEQAADRLEE